MSDVTEDSAPPEREFPDDETLLDYVRGRAPDDIARRIAAEAEDRPDLAAEIALMRGIGTALTEAPETNSPGALGWARLERALSQEAPAAAAPAPKPARAHLPFIQAAALAVGAVALWQVAIVPVLPGGRGLDPAYVPVTQAPLAAATATVAFVGTASEAEIRALLSATEASIIAGPSALGLWTLGFDSSDTRAAALERYVLEPGIIESAQPD